MSAKLEGWGLRIKAFLIDALLILIPGLIWMFIFGRVEGFQDMGDMAYTRRLFLVTVISAGAFYLLSYLVIQIVFLRKRRQTIGMNIMGLK